LGLLKASRRSEYSSLKSYLCHSSSILSQNRLLSNVAISALAHVNLTDAWDADIIIWNTTVTMVNHEPLIRFSASAQSSPQRIRK